MISTKGRYALRVMLDLAEQPENTYIPLKEIAARWEICQTFPMWEKFDRMVHDFFYGISLADLLKEERV